MSGCDDLLCQETPGIARIAHASKIIWCRFRVFELKILPHQRIAIHPRLHVEVIFGRHLCHRGIKLETILLSLCEKTTNVLHTQTHCAKEAPNIYGSLLPGARTGPIRRHIFHVACRLLFFLGRPRRFRGTRGADDGTTTAVEMLQSHIEDHCCHSD